MSATAAREGVALCLQTVLPSLFPFFVLSSLLVQSDVPRLLSRAMAGVMYPLFGVSGAGASALILGLLGGYPVGARTVAELYGRGEIGREEAEQLLAFCNNSGPGFFLGVCGTAVFGSARAGAYLYLIHVGRGACDRGPAAARPRPAAPEGRFAAARAVRPHRGAPRGGAELVCGGRERQRLCDLFHGAAAAPVAHARACCAAAVARARRCSALWR